MNNVSATIITFNEEKNIERCLLSLIDLVDEIVVLDSYSSDNTAKICQKYPSVKFIQSEWKGYANTKNKANQLAKHDWVLSLDADEVLSEELIRELKNIKLIRNHAYEFDRLTSYCGKFIHHCGWSPDIKVRLFDKKITQWEGNVHEHLVYTNEVKKIRVEGKLFHYSYHHKEEHLERLKKYAKLFAEEMSKKGKKASIFKFYFSPLFKFLKVYFMQLGFLDGVAGFEIAKNESKYTFWKYHFLKQKK